MVDRLRYRKPSPQEQAKLERSREMMARGIEGERDFLSRMSPTMAKAARDEQRAARQLRESVPEEARTYEGLEGMRRGGMVKKMGVGKSASQRADGIAKRGKTRGRMV